ncbi:eCIS core domain-containing protein [Natranaeroarchaeum aerophilus]|uniref:DUF4157 domain-containing protein n=1 Tax=Natranaeroarchaeum aerophilus TaxID=2917711 RepID=A0AAE3FP00_9EURY|nr:DUF4157 domain-containing protein [Natranaeroarchaeum aerophilus]MCL9812044.1 DUF4157 domain-containing protein [Natranaeroarchaeum aerophilus]
MAFRSARENTDDSASDHSSAALRSDSSDATTGDRAGGRQHSGSVHEQYDTPQYPRQWRKQLMRREKQYGAARVSQWASEGMPVESMGSPAEMDAVREQQADHSAAVPDSIAQDNEVSLYRSKTAQHETGPAGDTGLSGVSETVRDVISSPGTDLDSDVKSNLEENLGRELDHVQVHTGPKAQHACEEVNARAFTVGNHIAFGPGEYDPGSPEGQHLIAHEVVHTLQQPDAPMSMMPKAEVAMEIDPDPQAEREADEVAERVVKGDQVGIDSMWNADVHVQRSVKSKLSGGMSAVKESLTSDDADNEASEFIDLDGGDLSETVGALVENQKQIIGTLQGQGRSAIDKIGEATGKGVVGGTVGLGVAAMGMGPVAAAIAGGAMADVGKTLYGDAYQKGTTAISEVDLDAIADKVKARISGTGHGGETVAGEGGHV